MPKRLNKSQMLCFVMIGVIVGAVMARMVYSKTNSGYSAITVACVIVNQAVDHQLLTIGQVKKLGIVTGKQFRKNNIELDDEQLKNAAQDSVCHQLWLGMYGAQANS